jgi:hypothetical protein
MALRSINRPTPHDQLLLARAFSVDDWVLATPSAPCGWTVSLTLSEARQMSIKEVVPIPAVREGIHSRST